ncbi:MAG: carboxymuconolactone decarboxylase family protein [Gloeotrichia echinulata CP02]|nr:carboxymuconolactone decarboxylase family protein [Gloeotrichia echinulata DEX184]
MSQTNHTALEQNGKATPYTNAVLDDRKLQDALNSINPKFGDFCSRVAGEAWGLPLIDQKTKALITIAVDVVNQDQVGSGSPFAAHVNMALQQGATRAEIEELLLFLCVYAGFNKAAGCFGTLNDILNSNE